MTKMEQENLKLDEQLHEIDIEMASLQERIRELDRKRVEVVGQLGKLPYRSFLSEIQEQRRK